MYHFLQYRYYAATLLVIGAVAFFFVRCVNNEATNKTTINFAGYDDYAGAEKCMACHKEIYDMHLTTAHFHTSSLATAATIKGSFEASKNTFVYTNGSNMRMEKTDSGFYQVGYINGVEKKRQRFDVVIGSGTKGQSFASWQPGKLAQLPLTFFTAAAQWSNSPGYPNHIAFNRPVTSRCIECHATFAHKISPEETEPEIFDKEKLILSIGCERCHGPAAKHVAFHTENKTDTQPKYIINPAQFTRSQQIDMCALCHGGRLQKTKPSFTFTVGNKLEDYFKRDTIISAAAIDVHGNQYGLLQASKCYTKTNTLTCNSCHSPHDNERGKAAVFTRRCINCHNSEHNGAVTCKINTISSQAIEANCINCHMPLQPSLSIAVMLQGQSMPERAMMHTHYIGIYAAETKKILQYINNSTIKP
jgi:hypothetical protein